MVNSFDMNMMVKSSAIEIVFKLWGRLGSTKGWIMSEKYEGFLHLQFSKQNTPKHYPKLLHPVHDNDKILTKYNTFQVKKYYRYEL